jgi:uncharacterized protein (DUF2141 family)
MTRIIRLAAILLAAQGFGTAASAQPAANDLQVQLSGLRSAKGIVHFCLSANPDKFLRCQDDRSAVSRSVPVGQAGRVDLGPVRPGTYALLVIHDENSNGKLDMTFGIPREGFGFSNNPAMRPRPPHWDEIRFTVPAAATVQQIRVRYVL